MPYRIIFDVSDRIPDIWLGAVALVILIFVLLAGIWDVDGLLPRWPLVLAPAAALVAFEGVVDQLRIIVLGSLLLAVLICSSRALCHSDADIEQAQSTGARRGGIARRNLHADLRGR